MTVIPNQEPSFYVGWSSWWGESETLERDSSIGLWPCEALLMQVVLS